MQFLREAVRKCSFDVHSYLDHLYRLRPIKEVFSSGKETEDSVLSRNRKLFVTGLRYGKVHFQQDHEELKPGDLIEISRIGSSHWALYVGDDYVIHLAPPGENSEAGGPTGLGVVKKELLLTVVQNCSYEVNNHLDHLYRPRPIKQMLRSAEKMVGKEMECSDLSRNSERFVTDLRYGKAGSRQLREEPKPGDLIEISRIGSSHWALYLGESYVIHLIPPGEYFEDCDPNDLWVVTKELLEKVLKNCSYEVNNHLDHLYRPRPIKEVLRSTEMMVDTCSLLRNSKHFVSDLRYGEANSRLFREEPKPGDLIEIFRFFNSHWAVYVGDGYVIHLEHPGKNSETGTPTGLAVAKRELFVDVVGQCFYKVHNHFDHMYRPRPIKEMLRSAEEMVGKEIEDSDPSKNSEHFVTDLRYGKARSRQFCEEPKLGDLIEISRIGSSDWTFYVGNGYVIHLAHPGENSEAGALSGLRVVKRELLVEVGEHSSYKVNNHLDHVYRPQPIKEMLRSVEEVVGKEMECADLSRNSEHFVTDLRYGKARSRQLREEPKPGDLIEIFRIFNSHWALYVGDGFVIHLAPPGENSEAGAPTGLGVVKRELLVEVLENSSYKVNNLLDHLYRPRPIKEMLRSAEEMVGKEMECSDLSRNCERFVIDLRYGKASSRRFHEEPTPGDLIEISRNGSSHWALYAGDGYVIHLAPPGENSEAGPPTDLGVVKRELLVEVVEISLYKVNNHLDHLYRPRPIKEILSSGKEMLGKEMECSDLSRNSEHFVTDLRYGKSRSRQLREEPQPGDLIEIYRIGYSHWALYEGDGYVIHLASSGENSEAGSPTVLRVVKRELLVEVLGNSSYKVNNYLDHLYKPWPIKKIIEFGRWLIGRKTEYSVLSRNCKRFLTDLRYGKDPSQQRVEDPRPGDIIKISHWFYCDWAVYVGEGYVIHLTSQGQWFSIRPSEVSSRLTGRTKVTKELLQNVVSNCSYEVNNHSDHKYRPQPEQKIIASATKMIGNDFWFSNSKCFVADLRYGLPRRKLASEDPIPGDLVEIDQGVDKHWALYVGDGFVIHATTSGVSSGPSSSNNAHDSIQAMVKYEPLKAVAGDDKYKVNNYLDNQYRPRPVHDIVMLAKKKVGETLNDNLCFPTVST